MKEAFKTVTQKLGFEIRNIRSENRLVSLKTKHDFRGHVLLSYIIESFLLKNGAPIPCNHTHFGESRQIANVFLELGYDVDVINYTNQIFIPKKNYSFFIGARTNFQRIAQLINKECVKIVHLDTAHWLFNNSAEYQRCLSVQQRRGYTLKSFRPVDSNWAIEYADYGTVLGNDFTISTYRYAQKPLFKIPVPSYTIYPWPEDKDYNSCRNNFLWFGSHGLVHKGLDLVLEAFVNMPDYHLTVCGSIHEEKEFEQAFYKELYQSPNIHTLGWIDVTSSKFIQVVKQCIGLIYPSCSEGQSGAVVTCLQVGLIPIISYESGVSVDGFGMILEDCSVDKVTKAIKTLSQKPAEELEFMARKAWEYARANHTQERFAAEFKKIIEHVKTY